ncbi:hypothetical protein BN381_330105 [Candidatus Microthrix parvicella RN1]|uniref:Uncharacterized protein n=2 Tax=Candidatus Neomicrothrix TaxID=41949 RepID=R4Z0B5_9ACTN|nr:hypothetical protein BN381_330105 [Candidatus Microthrix parvicella RN1]
MSELPTGGAGHPQSAFQVGLHGHLCHPPDLTDRHRSRSEHVVDPPFRDGPQHRQRIGRQRHAGRTAAALRTADRGVDGHQFGRLTAAHTPRQLKTHPVGLQQPQEERRNHQRAGALLDGAEHPHRLAVQRLVPPTVGGQLLGHLQRGRDGRQTIQVGPGGRERVDPFRLGHNQQLTAALVQLHGHMAPRVQPRPEFGTRAPHALGNSTNSAPTFGEQNNDSVGLAQLVGAHHHGRIADQGHRGNLPAGRHGQWMGPGACSPGSTPHFSGKWLDTLKFQHISLAGVHTGLSDRSDVVWPAPVWAFAEVGDRVFVGGRFIQVRRGPAPPGTTSRSWRPSTGTAASDVGRAVGDPR